MKSCYWFLDFIEDWPHDMLGSSPYLAVNCKLASIRCIWCWCWSMSWQDDRCEVWVFCRLAELLSLWISQSMKKTNYCSELDSSHKLSFVFGRQAVAASVVSFIIDDHWEYLLQALMTQMPLSPPHEAPLIPRTWNIRCMNLVDVWALFCNLRYSYGSELQQ